jgi:hypothetical protein
MVSWLANLLCLIHLGSEMHKTPEELNLSPKLDDFLSMATTSPKVSTIPGSKTDARLTSLNSRA